MPKRKSDAKDASTLKKKRTSVAPSGTRRVTRRMMTDAARRAVFDTAELLEQIMLQLPLTSILTSQRVCHQFQDMVTTSSKIQEKLFFRTNGEHERWVPVEGNDAHVAMRPADDSTEEQYLATVPARLNDSFQYPSWRYDFWGRLYRGESIAPKQSLRDELLNLLRDNTIVSSSRGMQITDKPTTQARVWYQWDVGGAGGVLAADIDVATGITIGDLVKAASRPASHSIWEPSHHYYKVMEEAKPLMEEIQAMELKYGQVAKLTVCDVILHGVIIPTEKERDEFMSSTGSENTEEQ